MSAPTLQHQVMLLELVDRRRSSMTRQQLERAISRARS